MNDQMTRPFEVLDNPWAPRRTLQLGCGMRPMNLAVNVDRWKHSSWVDVAQDLDEMPWNAIHQFVGDRPLFQVVCAYDVAEHLRDVYGMCNEVWDLLVPGGLFEFRIGAADNPASWTDLTHRAWATPDSFNHLDVDHLHRSVYGEHYLDSIGRTLRGWRVLTRGERTNPDPRWPETGDLLFRLEKPLEALGTMPTIPFRRTVSAGLPFTARNG